MNKELIQKLFSKSCWDEQAEVDIEDFISVEKFAELIVAECIDTYDHWATHSMDKTAFVVARTHVKEHFGIEQ